MLHEYPSGSVEMRSAVRPMGRQLVLRISSPPPPNPTWENTKDLDHSAPALAVITKTGVEFSL